MAFIPEPFKQDKTGLSLGYRMRWTLSYTVFTVLGPADRQPHLDPKRRLRRERAQKIIDAHREAGTEPSQQLIILAQTGEQPR